MENSSKNDFKTGTTTVGLIAGETIVLAADMRASFGHIAYDEESRKLYKITDFIGVTNAGAVGDSLTLVRFLRSQANLYEIERDAKITPKAIVTYLSNVLNANRYYPFSAQFVLGGINDGPEIYELTPYGGVLKRTKYAVSGSGTEPAMTTLDLNYKTGMTETEGIALAIQAVNSGKKRDIYSGGKGVAVMVINRNGLKELSEADVKKHMPKNA